MSTNTDLIIKFQNEIEKIVTGEVSESKKASASHAVRVDSLMYFKASMPERNRAIAYKVKKRVPRTQFVQTA